MTKRFFALLRYTAVIAMIASLFVFSGCNDDNGPAVFSGTVAAYIADDQFKEKNTGSADTALDSLVKYVSLYPDLMTVLSASTDVTLFAPSNTAFKNLLATPGFPTQISLISPDLIKGVLSYHIVSGKKLKADLTSGATLTTMFTDATSPSAAQMITVNSDGTLLTGSTNANIDIVVADKQASNGVVQIVESVMIPPSVGASLTPILGTMAGTVLLGKDFTLFARLIARADAGFTENPTTGVLKIVTHLARPVSGDFAGATFFATPNAVIEAAATAQGVSSTAFVDSFSAGADGVARKILLNQYVKGRYVVTAASGATTLSNGATLTPLSGTTKNITVLTGQTVSAQVPYGVVLSNTPGTSSSFRPIVVKDLPHTNGYIQVFGGLFLP
jgi:uncharacterized surface protein with fasciclin (FAS1) repeats